VRAENARRAAVLAAAVALLVPARAAAQLLSDLEPERPVLVEDARPLPFRAISASMDWSYNVRSERINDWGPGFSLLYGAARGLELGSAIRYVTRPGRNALRGIASGDLEVHALLGLTSETALAPAVALRIGVQFPTGLDSRGTDLHLAGLFTRSFDVVRVHANVRWFRLGDTLATERADRFEGIVGADFLLHPAGRTDTLVVADAAVRSNPVVGGRTIVELEAGARQRIGLQTIVFVGLGSESTGDPDRAKFRARAGITHVF
jgi:hypothetical protein